MPDTLMPRRKLPPLVKDLCYLRHDERELTARVFMPVYDGGPFPCLIDLHGGGWQRGNLENRNASADSPDGPAASLSRSISGTAPMLIRAASSTSITASAGSRRTPRG
jgi:acetyl esterase/lipase